jgi:hypothetical protein
MKTMTDTNVRRILLLGLCLCTAASFAAGAMTSEEGWKRMPEILKRIVPPTFPDRDFVITDFGGLAHVRTDNTEAFRKAIEACHAAGGGGWSYRRGHT